MRGKRSVQFNSTANLTDVKPEREFVYPERTYRRRNIYSSSEFHGYQRQTSSVSGSPRYDLRKAASMMVLPEWHGKGGGGGGPAVTTRGHRPPVVREIVTIYLDGSVSTMGEDGEGRRFICCALLP